MNAEKFGRISAGWALCQTRAAGTDVVAGLEDVYRAGHDKSGVDMATAVAAAGALAVRGAGTDEMKAFVVSALGDKEELVRASAVAALSSGWAKDRRCATWPFGRFQANRRSQ